MADSPDVSWGKFFTHRTKPIWERFPGEYRSLVVETADPLNIGRIRFQCPDLHDYDLKPEDCPWAVPSRDLGGKGMGRFTAPTIGDFVWVSFERQHPYGPIWTGYATPTRRQFYPLPAVHIETPVTVDSTGKAQSAPHDYNDDYLPADRRPMSHGWQDRYGTLDCHSAVGYYPAEHAATPPPPDHDAVGGSDFRAQTSKPLVNQPDLKYSARVTKYGNMLILGDQGYYWQKSTATAPAGSAGGSAGGDNTASSAGGSLGEFTGDFVQDNDFEVARWKYLQKLINEGHPNSSDGSSPVPGGDQRRFYAGTRYGNRFEMRDVGWAQAGPIPSKSRPGEYGEPRTLSAEDTNDFRWMKWRSKGGMLLQSSDKGFHPQDDKFIQRKLIEEVGHLSEREDKHWANKDARWFRMVTRYGIKLVLDDRGSDTKEADEKELPRANGFLIKGRRSPAAAMKEKKGNPRGFYIEFNENDALNHLTVGTPLGSALELNDRYEYVALATSLGKGYATKWRGLEENEFLLQPTRHPNRDPEHQSYHLVMDMENEYLRLKTRANRGTKPDNVVNPSGVGDGEEHQGLEARDGQLGLGPWIEVVDCQSRGMWFTKMQRLGIWRGAKNSFMYQWMDDGQHITALYNDNDDGKTQIYCRGSVEIFGAQNVSLNGYQQVNIKGGQQVTIQGGNSVLTLKDDQILYNNPFVPGGQRIASLTRPVAPDLVEPNDRATLYNGPFAECPRDEVEHPIQQGDGT